MDKYLFVSDIHGIHHELYAQLSAIADGNDLPKKVFFLGDVSGTDLLDQLQKLFYNRVYNHMKALLKTNPDPTDEEILSYPIISSGDTLADGCNDLWLFLKKIDPEYPVVYVPDYARELVQYAHFGHFCSNLPTKIKEIIKCNLELNAFAWIDLMNRFAKKGVQVEVIEGNWDARTPVDFLPTRKYCKPVPIKHRSYYFANLLKQCAHRLVHYRRRVTSIKTKNEIFVLWPFDCAITPTPVPKFDKNDSRKIILVSHAQIDWNPIKGDTAMTEESQRIQENMSMTFRNLKPDAAVHGHLHDNKCGQGYYFDGKPVHYLPMRTYRFIEFS